MNDYSKNLRPALDSGFWFMVAPETLCIAQGLRLDPEAAEEREGGGHMNLLEERVNLWFEQKSRLDRGTCCPYNPDNRWTCSVYPLPSQ